MSHIFNWVWHGVTRCPENDLEHTMYGTTHCRTCGRVAFVSDTLPKIKRLIINKRNRHI